MNKLANSTFFNIMTKTKIPFFTRKSDNREYTKMFGDDSELNIYIKLLNTDDWKEIHDTDISGSLFLIVLVNESYKCVRYTFRYIHDHNIFDTHPLYISGFVDYDPDYFSLDRMIVEIDMNGLKFTYIGHEPILDLNDSWHKTNRKKMEDMMLDLNVLVQYHRKKLFNLLKFLDVFLECGLDIE